LVLVRHSVVRHWMVNNSNIRSADMPACRRCISPSASRHQHAAISISPSARRHQHLTISTPPSASRHQHLAISTP
jgi:hypothetical protein